MIEALLGLPGKMKKVLDRLTNDTQAITNTRVSNLDNLDAAMTTRAPAATALSTATWTSGKAAYLDDYVSKASPPVTTLYCSGWTTIDTGMGSYVSGAYNYDSPAMGSTDTYYEVMSVTAPGVLYLLGAMTPGSTSGAVYLKLTIDGDVVATDVRLSSIGTAGYGGCMVGCTSSGKIDNTYALRFKTSIKVEIKSSATQSANAFKVFMIYTLD